MRADKYFAERYGSRTKAKDVLERGLILRGGKPLSPKDEILSDEGITFLENNAFASHGGAKLERGLDYFEENVEGCTFADLGASTGGFTDCLLRRGASRVFCVDVGESQLDSVLKNDNRIVVMDKTNARYLKPGDFSTPLDGVVADLSFISLRHVLGAIYEILPTDGRAFLLFKPQFECEGVGLGKSGILPFRYHAALLDGFYDFACASGLFPQNAINAPIREKKNIEYMLFLKKDGEPIPKWEFLQRATCFCKEK